MNGIHVEVELSKAYYPAVLTSIEKNNGIVIYQNELDSPHTVPLSSLRLPPIAPTEPLELSPNLEIDAQLVLSSVSPQPAWVPALVHTVRKDVVLVTLCHNNTAGQQDTQQLVDLTNIRLRCSTLTGNIENELCTYAIQISQDLVPVASNPENHSCLRQFCGHCILFVDPDSPQIVVVSTDPEVIRKVKLLEDCHLRVLKQRLMFEGNSRSSTSPHEKKHEGQVVESFQVARKFLGLSMGKQHKNFSEAMRIEGVVDVDLDEDTSTFTVYAKTQEAASKARAILEFIEDSYKVPVNIVAQMIGKHGANIQEIVDKSGVIRVVIDEENPERGEELVICETVPFLFVGTSECVRNALLLVEFQVESYQDLVKIQTQNSELLRELRVMERDTGGRGSAGYQRWPASRAARDGVNHRFHNGGDRNGYDRNGVDEAEVKEDEVEEMAAGGSWAAEAELEDRRKESRRENDYSRGSRGNRRPMRGGRGGNFGSRGPPQYYYDDCERDHERRGGGRGGRGRGGGQRHREENNGEEGQGRGGSREDNKDARRRKAPSPSSEEADPEIEVSNRNGKK